MRCAVRLLLLVGLISGTRLSAQVPVELTVDTTGIEITDTLVSSLAFSRAYRNSVAGMQDWTYIASGYQGGWLTDYFEANLAPVYLVRLDVKPERQAAFWLTLVPQVTFRMFDEESSPIRTPSFHPALHFNYLPNTYAEDAKEWTTIFIFTLAHHSNGSAGAFAVDSQQVPGQPPRLNFLNGNFSTNYFGLGIQSYHYVNRSEPNLRARFWSWQLRAQYHGGIAGTALQYEPGMEGTYGRVRSQASIRLHTEVGRLHMPSPTRPNLRLRNELAVDLQTGWIWGSNLERFGSSGFERRFHVRGQVLFKPINFYETALFAQIYWGHDYYNIRYSEQVFQVRIGLQASMEPFLLRSPRPTVLNRRLQRSLGGNSRDWDR